MNNTEEFSDLHLQGKLQGDALQQWQEHLARNPDLQAEHLAKQRTIALLELSEQARLKALLQQSAAQNTNGAGRFGSWQPYSLAALFFGLLCVGLYYLYQAAAPNYLHFDIADYGVPNTMSAKTSAQSLFHEAMNAYKEAQYQEALQGFERLLAEQSSDTLIYYKALSQFRLQQYSEALEGFATLAEQPESPYQSKAAYRQALSLLLLGRGEEAKVILRLLKADKAHLYQEEIARLCEVLHL